MLFGSSTGDRHARCIYLQTFSTDENHSYSQWRGRKRAIVSSCLVLPPEIAMLDAYIGGCSEITLNVSLCITISGGRTEQLDIFCRVTGFTSHFLSFIDVEHIRLFHGALQLQMVMVECAVIGRTCTVPASQACLTRVTACHWTSIKTRVSSTC